MTASILRWECKNITIYPYGGCSNFSVDINIPLWQELLVLIMGPVTQIIFIYIIKYIVDSSNYLAFKEYSNLIIMFNMLPIYPLDGGRLLNIVLSFFISFYKSYQITIYFSFFIYINCILISICFYFNILLLIIEIVLGISLIKEIRNSTYYYQKFLLERYYNSYNFSKIIMINRLQDMKRDFYHIISGLPEKEYLKRIIEGFKNFTLFSWFG